jgi:Caspase domain
MKHVFFLLASCLIQAAAVAQEFKGRSITVSIDLTRPVEPNTLPNVQWVSPFLDLTGSPTNEVKIETSLLSLHAISEVKVKVRCGEEMREQLVSMEKNEYAKRLVIDVVLFEGLNEVCLSVANTKGGRVSSCRSIKVEKNVLDSLMHVNRRDYALIFATDKYDEWKDLYNPIASAQALAKVLETDYGFEAEIVKNPSHGEITKKLAEYETKSYSPQDQLFVYFGGNCYFDKLMGYGYLVASNSTKGEAGSYLAQKDLRTMLNNFKCEHILLAVDACCADLADTKMMSTPSGSTLTQTDIVAKLAMKTRKFLNPAYLEYTADNIPGHVSPFTTQLIDALKQKAGQRSPKTFSEVNSYFKDIELHSGGFGWDNAKSEFLFMPK